MNCLVTGGRGFIGAAVVAALTRAGISARAGVRKAGADTRATVACDLDDPAQTRAAVVGVQIVVHTAYGEHEAMARQCADLLAAMSGDGVENLIYFSSIAVYGEASGAIDESTAPTGALDGYGAGKIECEKCVREWAEDPAHPNRRAIVLRPGIVYGAGSQFWIDKLGRRIRLGAWGRFGRQGEGVAALVHIDDLTDIVTEAAKRLSGVACADLPNFSAFNVVGPETPSWNDYFVALANAIGAPELPALDAATLARRNKIALAAKIWRRFGLPGGEAAALAPTPGELALFSRKADYSTQVARSLLGFAPRVSLRDGLARSAPQTNR